MSSWFNYGATLRSLVFGLLVGAGLPALFALGVRIGAVNGTPPTRTARLASGAVFALVLAVVILGVLFIARDFIAAHTSWYLLGAKPHET